MPSTTIADLETATAVSSTPAERLPVASLAQGSASSKAHFNASLDMALHILKQQDLGSSKSDSQSISGRGDSSTPVNWASTDIEGSESTLSQVDSLLSYSATADDLILNDSKARVSLPSRSAHSGLSSTMAGKDTQAECQVRARIPYPGGHFYLHLYHTDEDEKEHLAIVFGDDIRSKTLELAKPGESDMDRKIRGASTGALRSLVQKDIARRQLSNRSGQEPAQRRMGFEPDPVDSFVAPRVSLVEAPLVRIHSECFTGETVSSVRCDCGYQLAEAMRLIQREGRGVIVYLRQEGRGIGLLEKLKAYNLQDMGHDTVDANLLLNHPADARTYGSARAILADLGVDKLRLLTNNTDKIRQLQGHGSSLDIACHVPMYPRWWGNDTPALSGDGSAAELSYSRHLVLQKNVMAEADLYLKTKAQRMGHMLSLDPTTLPLLRSPAH
ncbi:GTP cyclohydrolase II [Coemansia spiralis]|uniref:GTP cyclohydrolase II n=1 Tax=Coemansia spiralis TaxID=417178 RepID=A0A9W8GIJ0_9FUNG|nr:GTP cyclohydrolase II [Coemansia spiralis]